MDDMSAIYQQHAQTVYKFLLAQCRDPDLAEELTQETFYQAVRSADRFDGGCKVSVWLCQIAKHLWYQHLRKRNREALMPEEGIDVPLPSAEEETLAQEGRLDLLRPARRRPGGGVSPGLRRPQLPGDRRRAGENRDLGESDLLPEQGKTAERRNRR